jgi:ParB/RepB/Spo0J family partition protein
MTIAPVLQSDDVRTPSRIDLDGESMFHLPPIVTWDPLTTPVALLPIESILVSRNGHGEAGNLGGLTASIQARGVLEPLIVAPDGRLLAGRRRLEAARRAGLAVVPVRVCEIADERTAIEIGLVENVERADLDPLTRAKSYHGLIEQGATVEEIARLVGQGTGHVYQHLALLDLHSAVQASLHARTISFADARSLVPLEHTDQAVVFREIRTSPKPLSSRQVKMRVDARRVMRLVRQTDDPGTQGEAETLTDDSLQEPDPDAKRVEGNYAALFAVEDATTVLAQPSSDIDRLDQINALIAEMVSAAQGEDQVRAWARRLSRVLEALQEMKLAEATSKKKSASAAQDRLL